MPNWCENKITITGKDCDILEIKKIIKKLYSNPTSGFMEAFVGKHPKGDEPSPGLTLSYNTQYWGTKWDVDIEKVGFHYFSDDKIVLEMRTAWSPPEEFCKKLSEKYNVIVKNIFFELGCFFNGCFTYNGESIKQFIFQEMKECIYQFDKNYFWNTIYNQIDMLVDEDSDEDDDFDLTSEFLSLYNDCILFLDEIEKLKLKFILNRNLTSLSKNTILN